MFPSAPAQELELTPQGEPFLGELFSPSPFHFRFTGEDAIEIASYNSQSGTRVAVQGRMWNPTRGITPFAFSHVPNTDRTRAIERFGLANGYLLNVVVFASSGAPVVGQTFISLHVTRGQGAARYLLATLLQGYVTAEQELGFPGSPLMSSIQGNGYPRVVTGTNPAAGVFTSTETVPTGARWEALTYTVDVAASAVAGNRGGSLLLYSGGLLLGAFPQRDPLLAATSITFTWAQGAADGVTGVSGVSTVSLPIGTILSAGGQLLFVLNGAKAGDDIAAPTFSVREWLEAQ